MRDYSQHRADASITSKTGILVGCSYNWGPAYYNNLADLDDDHWRCLLLAL